MKFVQQISVLAETKFIFQDAPSTRPEGDLQSPEILAETISERETLEAAILNGLTAGIEARRAEGRVPVPSVIALSELLQVEDSLTPEDFRIRFNLIWSQVPPEIRTSIINAASAEASEEVPEASTELGVAVTYLNENREMLEQMFSSEQLSPIFEVLSNDLSEVENSPEAELAKELSVLRGVLHVVSTDPGLSTLLENPDYISADINGRMDQIREFYSATGERLRAAAEPYEPSPEMAERSTTALGFLDEFGDTLNAFMTEDMQQAFPGIALEGAPFADFLSNTIQNPDHEAEHTLALILTEFFESQKDIIERMVDGTATDEDRISLRESMQTLDATMTEALSALLPEPVPPAAVAETETPLSPEAERLIDGVSDYLRNTYSQHFEAWEAAIRSGEMNPLQPFNEYLAALPEYQTEFGQLALQISMLINDLMPILEALGIDWFNSDEESIEDVIEDDPVPETVDPEGRDEEVVPVSTRIVAFNTFFQASGAPIIAEFSSEQEGSLVYDSEAAADFLAEPENGSLTVANIEATVNQIKDQVEDEAENFILQRGLGLSALEAIAELPEGALESVDANGIVLANVSGRVLFEGDFEGALASALDAHQEAVDRIGADVESQAAQGEINLEGIHIVAQTGEVLTPALFNDAQSLMSEFPLSSGVFDKGLSVRTIQNFVNVLGNEEAVADGWITLRNNDVLLDTAGIDTRRSFPYQQLTRDFDVNLFTEKLEEIQEEINE